MELYEKLSKNMEELAAVFTSRMAGHEKELQEASTSARPGTIAALSREFADFKAFVTTSLTILRSQVDLLLLGLDRHEMASRRKVLLMHGVPETAAETVSTLVSSLLTDKMNVSADCASSVSVCHRLGVARDKPRPILVRFSTVAARNEAWAAKKTLKGTTTLVSEFLTKSRHDVFMTARKHFGVSGSWTTEGRVVILLPDKSRAKVEQMAELRELMEKFPSKVSDTSPSAKPARRPRRGAKGIQPAATE